MLQASRPNGQQNSTSTYEESSGPDRPGKSKQHTTSSAALEITAGGKKLDRPLRSWVPSFPKDLLDLLHRNKKRHQTSISGEDPRNDASIHKSPPPTIPLRTLVAASQDVQPNLSVPEPTRSTWMEPMASSVSEGKKPCITTPTTDYTAPAGIAQSDSFLSESILSGSLEPSTSSASKTEPSSLRTSIHSHTALHHNAQTDPRVSESQSGSSSELQQPKDLTDNLHPSLPPKMRHASATRYSPFGVSVQPQPSTLPNFAQQHIPELTTSSRSSALLNSSKTDAQYTTVKFRENYFISPEMPISDSDFSVWRDQVEERLEQALQRNSMTTDDRDSYTVIEFYMVGTKEDQLNPTIGITRSSKRREKELRRILRRLDWLKNTGFQHLLILDKSFAYKGELWTTDASKFKIELKAGTTMPRTCGTRVRVARVLSGTPSARGNFTIGGFLSVDGRIYGLTTAHPLFHMNDVATRASIESENSTSDSEDLDAPGSDGKDVQHNSIFLQSTDRLMNTGGTLQHRLKNRRSGSTTDREIEPIAFENVGLIYRFALDSTNRSGGRSMKDEDSVRSSQDWALVDLLSFYIGSNSFRLPGDMTPRQIEEYVPADTVVAGSVWILTEDGPREGKLTRQSAHIQLGISSFQTQQITVEGGVAQGDSGSWVLHNGKLCGYIIAGRTALPWAYMLPIGKALQSISQRLGGMEVRLPRHQELYQREINWRDTFADPIEQGKSSGRPKETPYMKKSYPPGIKKQTIDKVSSNRFTVGLSRRSLKLRPRILLVAILMNGVLCGMDISQAAVVQAAIAFNFAQVSKLAWVGVAPALSSAIASPLWRQAYSVSNGAHSKIWLYMFHMVAIVAGNALCALSPDMNQLIVGRAISGLGTSGVFLGERIFVFTESVATWNQLHFYGVLPVTWAFGLCLGPIIGGIYANTVTWKWTFGLSAAIEITCTLACLVLLTMDGRLLWPRLSLKANVNNKLTFTTKILRDVAGQLVQFFFRPWGENGDWCSFILSTGFLFGLVMLLSFGGSVYTWTAAEMIALYATTGAFLITKVLRQFYFSSFWTSRIPLNLIPDYFNSTLIIIHWLSFVTFGSFVVPAYYLPLFFQFTRGMSAFAGGLHLVVFGFTALGCAMYIGNAFVAGRDYIRAASRRRLQLAISQEAPTAATALTSLGARHPVIFSVFGSAVNLLGCAFMYSVRMSTSDVQLYIYIIMLGIGLGALYQSQRELIYHLMPRDKWPSTLQVFFISQGLGAAISLAAAGAIFQNCAFMAIQPLVPSNATMADIRSALTGTNSAPAANHSLTYRFANGTNTTYLGTLPLDVQADVMDALVGAFRKVWLLMVVLATVACVLNAALALLNFWKWRKRPRPGADEIPIEAFEDVPEGRLGDRSGPLSVTQAFLVSGYLPW